MHQENWIIRSVFPLEIEWRLCITMSTQDGSSVPFEVSANQQNLRLLELPSSLADLLRSDNPPRSVARSKGAYNRNADHGESLFLKSTASSSDSATALSASGNAVLCTHDHTFELRQVHSSNSIFVIQPSQTALNDGEQSGLTTASAQAVAQCATTLELRPSLRSGSDLFRSLLPQYRGPEDNTGNNFPSQLVKGKEGFCEDAPLSRAEFDAAWVGLCAFELKGNAFLPTAPLLHGIWKSILSATVVKDLKLEVNVFIQDIAGLVEEDGFPRSLLQAVVYRLSVDQIIPMEGCESSLTDTKQLILCLRQYRDDFQP